MRFKNKYFYKIIMEEIKTNSKVTEKYLAEKYLVHERTVRRYFKDLKDQKKIEIISSGTKKEWKIL